MKIKKYKSGKTKKPKTVSEPLAVYEKNKNKPVLIFSSFEEENQWTAKERAKLSYNERMINAEKLRRLVYSEYLLPDGSWQPIEKKFKIMKPYVNEIN